MLPRRFTAQPEPLQISQLVVVHEEELIVEVVQEVRHDAPEVLILLCGGRDVDSHLVVRERDVAAVGLKELPGPNKGVEAPSDHHIDIPCSRERPDLPWVSGRGAALG